MNLFTKGIEVKETVEKFILWRLKYRKPDPVYCRSGEHILRENP
jgi:hypothetical protein